MTVSHSTVTALIGNAVARQVSPVLADAARALAALRAAPAPSTKRAGCSSCSGGNRKQNDLLTATIAQLRSAPDQELDRIKRAVGVDVLVFGQGLSFIER